MAKVKAVVLNKIGKDGLTNIKIRLTHQGKSREIGTDYYIPYEKMSSDGTVEESYPNYAKLNKVLRELIHEYYAIIDDLGRAIRVMSINDLVNHLKNKDLATSFTKYAEIRTAELQKEGRFSYATTYEAMLKHLQRFTGNVSFRDITSTFLQGFETYLKIRECKPNTRRIYLNNIRAIFNVARVRRVINIPNPFDDFKVKAGQAIKRALNVSDIRRLITGQYRGAVQRSVDIFAMILYLNGINFKDLLYIKPDNYSGGRIIFNRAKTGTPISIRVFPEAQRLIEKYRGEKYLLNFLDEDDSHEHYKTLLKETNKKLKVAFGGQISTYSARHSVASIMANLDIPIETVSMTLGHALPGSSMTGLYITFNTKKIDEAMEKVIAHISEPEDTVKPQLKRLSGN
jgi:integrase